MSCREAVVLVLVLGCSRTSEVTVAPANGGERAAAAVAAAPASDRDSDEARALRDALVDRMARGGIVTDRRVLDTMRAVPRHAFVPGVPLAQAYVDRPQPIGHGQTISQPTVVGDMTQALELTGGERVLEIGTGSGYQAAILARLAKEVYTIEILAPLGEEARARLARLGYANVHVRIGDGYQGWPEAAPFDRILLTAAPDEVPAALLDEVADGGILVAPVGTAEHQELRRYRREGDRFRVETLAHVRFVPMIPGKDRSP